jgi:hypothetical protein
MVVLDWGDCGVGHPLLDEAAFVARLATADADADAASTASTATTQPTGSHEPFADTTPLAADPLANLSISPDGSLEPTGAGKTAPR